MSDLDPGRDEFDLVDAMASAVRQADEDDLAQEAAAAGEDLAGAAASLRARFLDRVAAARAREAGFAEEITVVEARPHEDMPPSSPEDHHGPGTGDDEPDDEPQPLAIGRYPILRKLGAGGMGVVYAAYDELLDRRVAIKVLHSHVWDFDGRRRERLLREAQAMARVTHPNLVTVHEVGTADDQLFMAMEFVAGVTLEQWLAAERRSWREIVAVFRQIAEGLEALHAAGLVHRDVKPGNVILGDDGRVRVLDLGLVGADRHELGETEVASLGSSSRNRLATPLTQTGERLGTPAYMSREQFLGLELTPASDVFSFSVALYEALHGIHPFKAEAKTFIELQDNVIAGRLVLPPSSRAVPTWLHTLVVRGLAADPRDRPASMRDYELALGKDPSRTRRRWLGVAAIATLTTVAGLTVMQAPATVAPPSCDGGELALAGVWERDSADPIRSAMLATQLPYAEALATRIIDTLDDYAKAWAAAHDRICLEHARGRHSAALLDARMACLDRRRVALAETVAMLGESDAELVENAGQMVAKLPRLEPCDDLVALAARRSPPTDPELAAKIAELESRLVKVETLANAGRIDQATELADAVAAEAEALDQPATVVAALLAHARAKVLFQRDRTTTSALLERALTISLEHGLDAFAAEAMICRLYLRGLDPGSSEPARADLPIAEAMIARAGNDPELHALFLNNAGSIRLAAGDREGARAAFERSLVVKERLHGPEHLDIAPSLANLGMLVSDEEARDRLNQRMLAIYEQRLGPDHPRTLDARVLVAFYTADPELGSRVYADLCPRFVEVGDSHLVHECELERGRLEYFRARHEHARRAFVIARAQPDITDSRRVLLDGYLALDAADPQPAITELTELIAQTDSAPPGGWWVDLEQAERRLLLARLRAHAGDLASGVPLLERAITNLERIVEEAQPLERERLLATARAALALALDAADGDRLRIAALARTAHDYFAQWPDAYADCLDEFDLPRLALGTSP